MMMTPRAKPRQRVQLDSRHADITAAHEDPQVQQVPLDKIRTDGGTQMRAAIDEELVEDYAKLIHGGIPFNDPPEVCYDGTNYWLWDGFHRIAAYRKAYKDLKLKPDSIPCKVQQGDRRKAIVLAAGANDAHGKRRTNADKQRAVETFLRDDEWQHMTDAWIAEKCKVDPKTVAAHRRRLVEAREIPDLTTRQGVDGKVYDTTNIGANQPKRKRAPTPTEIRSQRPAPQPQPEPQPEPVQPGPVQTQFDADLQAYGYTIVCLGPDRYQWRTAGDSETGIGFGSGPVYATVYEALQDAMDKIAKQQAYERAQTDAEYWSQKDSRVMEPQRKAARLHNVAQVCELLLDSLTDYEQDTGDYGGSHEVRKWMRHMRETIQRHLDAYGGK